jgi:hypothetical protein
MIYHLGFRVLRQPDDTGASLSVCVSLSLIQVVLRTEEAVSFALPADSLHMSPEPAVAMWALSPKEGEAEERAQQFEGVVEPEVRVDEPDGVSLQVLLQ